MSMSEAAKKAQREYLRKWRAENKDKVQQYNKKFREEHPEKVKAARKNYWEKKAKEMSKIAYF